MNVRLAMRQDSSGINKLYTLVVPFASMIYGNAKPFIYRTGIKEILQAGHPRRNKF